LNAVSVRRIDVGSIEDLPSGTMRVVAVDDVDVLLVNLEGRVLALQGTCSHEYYDLGEGDLVGFTLTCPMHFSEFDVRDGSVLSGPAGLALQTYPVVVDGGRIVAEFPPGDIPVSG
jgi:3-phenylpropionate/trans-cinnamate dioxygenase ferredoxin subunit